VVGPASHALSRGAWYLSLGSSLTLPGLRDSHPLWCDVPVASEKKCHGCAEGATSTLPARNPSHATLARLARVRFRRIPFRSPLLRDLFCFLGVHEMFQFPHLPPTLGWVILVAQDGVAPFGDDGLTA
jgi:hypothetical protein